MSVSLPAALERGLEYTLLTLEPGADRFSSRRCHVPESEVDFNFGDPRFIIDPYPMYERLRKRTPVHRHPLGFWVITGYEDAQAVLKNSRQLSSDSRNARSEGHFTEPSAAFGGEQTVHPYLFWDPPRLGSVRPFMFLDEPDHRRLRSLVAKAFTRSSLTDYLPRLEHMVEGTLHRAMANDEINFVRDFSYPLPVQVICELLGIPAEDEVLFGQWSRPLSYMLTPDFLLTARQREEIRAALIAMIRYLLKLVASRRAAPRDDLLGALTTAKQDGDRLTEPEVIATVMVLLMAGHETTVALISNALLAMLAHPDQAEIIAGEEAITRQAVEETLRFDSPVQTAARTVISEVVIDGHELAVGDHVLILIGAANRDPAKFSEPDRYDVRRENAGRHIAFGSGIHTCVGSPLARMEGQAALGAIAERIPELELAQAPFYACEITVRGPDAILLRRRRGRTQHAVAGRRR